MGEGLTIAVVDDDAYVPMVIRRILEHTFAERAVRVLEGDSGEDAIALRFGAPTPDLLIVNWVMSGMWGPEAISEIRRREQAEHLTRVPFIFESACVPVAPVAGADAFLAKPFTLKDLIAVVEPLLAPVLGSRLTNRA